MKIGLNLVVVKVDLFEELEYSWVNFIVGWIEFM